MAARRRLKIVGGWRRGREGEGEGEESERRWAEKRKRNRSKGRTDVDRLAAARPKEGSWLDMQMQVRGLQWDPVGSSSAQ